jgi:hypothetical protein
MGPSQGTARATSHVQFGNRQGDVIMKTLIGQIYTANGKNFLSAINGGGLGGPEAGPGTVALHTDSRSANGWETFKLILQPGSPAIGPGMKFALQTSDGKHYVTAVNGGGVGGTNDAACPIHTDATQAGAWEVFTLLVNDAVNPPTVQIKPFGSPVLTRGYYLTAVDGGGIGGPGAQPIHTDAIAIGAWEQFSFAQSVASTASAAPNVQLNTNVPGPANGNIAGSISLTTAPDGTYSFSGKMNNSNWFPYTMAVAVVLVSSRGNAYTFAATGNIDAGLPWDNNNWSWANNGNSADMKAAWADLEAGWTYSYNVSATLDLSDLLNGVINGIVEAGTAFAKVIQVAGPLVALAAG